MPFFKIALLLFAVSVPAFADSVCQKWDFESGNNDWVAWGFDAKARITPEQRKEIVTVSADVPYEGRKCILLKNDLDAINPFMSTRNAIPVDPKKKYYFKGYIRSGDKTPVTAAVGIAAEANGKFVKWYKAKVDAGGDWRDFNVIAENIPAETTHLRPSVFVFENKSAPDAKGSVYADNMSLGECSLVKLDMSKAANRPFMDETAGDGAGGWTDQGDNDLRNMKGGEKIAGNIPFDIIAPARATDNAVIGLRKNGGFAGSAVLAVPDAACDWIYILNTAAWAKGKAGDITINYADGSSDTVAVNCGDLVGDWCNGSAKNAASVPLNDACPQKNPVYLFAGAIKNKYPEKAIKSLKFSSGNDEVVWLILGVSLGRGPNMLEASVVAQRDYSKWFSFKLKNQKSPDALVNLSFLLDAPAGKHGFLKSKDGKFVFEDGTPARFWGTNIHSNSTLFPTKEQAEAVADTLARYGVNLVRLHLTETRLIDDALADRQHFISDPEKLDRFDYFIKCFKDRGIYLLLDSVSGLSGRRFTAADGVAGYKEYYPHRPWAYYDPVLIAIGKKYMKDYLTHVNKYTGRALIDEPAVAMLMVINEESAFDRFKKNGDTNYYNEILAKLYSQWLLKTYGSREALIKAWTGKDGVSALLAGEDPAKCSIEPVRLTTVPEKWNPAGSSPRLRDSIRFYEELQTDYYSDVKEYLKALGCKVPVAGTNVINHVAELKTHLGMDYTSQNKYFDHVHDGVNGAMIMKNIPMTKVNPVAGDPALIEQAIAAVKVDRLPATSTETDAMWPHEWRASHMISLAAASALQDWDAIFQYCYIGGYGSTWDQSEKFEQIFNPTIEFNDPAIFGTFPASALIYHRRDVTPSKNLVQLVYNEKDSQNPVNKLSGSAFPFNYLTYVSRVESCFGQASPDAVMLISSEKPQSNKPFVQYSRTDEMYKKGALAAELDTSLKKNGIIAADRGLQDGRLVSDTGEIIRDWKNGLILVNTARTQGLTGFPGAKEIKFKDLSIKSPNLFATIIVSSLDGRDLAESSNVFLTTVGRAENSRDKISYGVIVKDFSGVSRGESMSVEKGKDGKVLTEIVKAEIKIKASSVKLTPLAPDMSAAAPAREFKAVNGVVTVTPGEGTPSVWYLLEIAR